MTDDNLTLPDEPKDLMIRGVQVQHEYLIQRYDSILSLLKLHENELVLLWSLQCAILVSMLVNIYLIHRLTRESNGRY